VRNAWVVLRRELLGLFGHPLAYVALIAFAGLVALLSLWFDDVLRGGVATMNRPFFWISACFLFFVPAITMRLIAEERRSGSLHLLATLPLRPVDIVLGKWLAAVVTIAVALAMTVGYPLALARLGPLDWGPVVGGYLGLLLMGGAFAAVGVATSAVTESQVIAFLLAAVVCAVPWVVGSALPLVPAAWVPVVQTFTFEYHFSNLARGVVDTRSLVFFGGVIAVGLRSAVLVLEHRRLVA
jgi:ABC-2 type transport system permease protein